MGRQKKSASGQVSEALSSAVSVDRTLAARQQTAGLGGCLFGITLRSRQLAPFLAALLAFCETGAAHCPSPRPQTRRPQAAVPNVRNGSQAVFSASSATGRS